MRKLIRFVALAMALVLALAGSEFASATANPTDGTLDTSFNGVLSGGSNVVTDTVLQPDGKIVVVGNFLKYNNVDAKYVVRINVDGTLDSTFNAGTSIAKTTQGGALTLKAVALQSDGKILIGGGFDSAQGHQTQAIARLNSDGSVDTTFVSPLAPYNMATNPNVSVESLALSDGAVIAVGTFAQALDSSQTAVTVNGVIKTSSTGNLDITFNNNFGGATVGSITGTTITGAGPNASTFAVEVQPDGKILVGGTFTVVGGTTGYIRRGLARLLSTGAVDSTFNAGLTGTSTNVYDIAVDSSGNVLAVGAMTGAGSTSSAGIVRLLSANGAFDTTFSGIVTGFTGGIGRASSVGIAADGSLYVGGIFTAYNQVGRIGLAHLFVDGTLDPNFTVGTGIVMTSSTATMNSIIALASGDILIGGVFDSYRGVGRTGLALLTSAAAVAARTAQSNNNSSNSNNSNSSNNSSTTTSSSNPSAALASTSGDLAYTGTPNRAPVALVGGFLVLAGLASALLAVARRRAKQQ